VINCRECGRPLTPEALAYIDVQRAAARRDELARRDVQAFLATYGSALVRSETQAGCKPAYPTAHTAPIQEPHDAAEQYAVDHLTAAYAGDDTSFEFMCAVLTHVGRYAEWEAL